MKCHTATVQMLDYIEGSLTAEDNDFMSAHLQECAACRKDYRQTLDMIDLLKEIPVTPASAGFVERSLSNAVRLHPATAGSRIKYVTGGVAAIAIVMVVALALVMGPASEHPDSTVVLIGNQVKTIKVAIQSSRVIEDIEMTIDVSANLEIEGYGQQQVINWNTRLEQGVNLIALPVSAVGAGDGEIVARLSLGGHEKTFRIRTRYQPEGSVGSDDRILARHHIGQTGAQL